jgi:hypothetical protein
MLDDPRKPGRPPGVKRPHKVFTYLDDEELQQLQTLAADQSGSVAAALRQAMKRAYQQRQEKAGEDE